MQTRNQKLAADVFARVERFKREYPNEKDHKKYGGMAHKLPVLIRTAGLAQAVAFLKAKTENGKEKMWKRLLDDLQATLGQTDLAARSYEAELSEYLRLTQQSLAALLWYKRFAQSVLNVAGSEDNNL